MLRVDIKQDYPSALHLTADIIRQGGLVLFPSDTVYILAVDPTNPLAVQKLLHFKERWLGKAISIAVADTSMAKKFVTLSPTALNIYNNLLPGPFTVVSQGLHRTALGIEAENGTLGIRIPDSQYILDLVKLLNHPITATSANLSGRSPHYSVESFLNTLSQKRLKSLDLIVDAGQLPKNKPSTVVDATESEIKILRRGDLVMGGQSSLVSNSIHDTARIAKFIFKRLSFGTKPIVLGLTGDLGAGKTVFSREIGNIIGVKDTITSPTFIIYNEYPIVPPHTSGITNFLHFDLYRLTDYQEYEDLHFLNLFKPLSLSCIEWPENMGKKLFDEITNCVDYYSINFEYVSDTRRKISFPSVLKKVK